MVWTPTIFSLFLLLMNLTTQSNQQSFTSTLSRLGKTLLVLSPLFLAGCQLSIQAPNLSSEDRAKFYLQAIARGQETYYKANGHFASSVDKLSINLNLDTPEYSYAIVSEGEKAERMTMTAAAKIDGLPSYAGLLVVKPSQSGVEAVANLCQTDGPSKTPPVFPQQLDPSQVLECPPGSIPAQ
jgi:Type IV pilin-like G and H, putative